VPIVGGRITVAASMRPRVPSSLAWGAPPAVQERDELGGAVVGAGDFQPGREAVDGDIARTQLVGEAGAMGSELETLTMAPP
jgi:hypothetical protein